MASHQQIDTRYIWTSDTYFAPFVPDQTTQHRDSVTGWFICVLSNGADPKQLISFQLIFIPDRVMDNDERKTSEDI